jgi:S-adenosylmethionine decarboxylase
MKAFGYELIIDLSDCSTEKFNREDLTEFFEKICDLIDMNREDLYFWDYEGNEEIIPYNQPHLVGISAVQFISTSDIVVHTLDMLKKVFVNIFSCKKFDKDIAEQFVKEYFKAEKCKAVFLKRE